VAVAQSAVYLRRLELEQFRSYESLLLAIPPQGLRIQGANGTGKSTLLEAIELLSTTRPRRGALDADVIRFTSGQDLGVAPYARVVGEAARGDAVARVEVFLQRGERRAAARKTFKIADRPRRATEVVGLLPTVRFSPDDLELALGAPAVRRRFLDVLLSQIDRRYLRALSRYAKIVSQRNGLLKRVAASGTNPDADEFAYWDEQLVALGAYIIAARAAAVAALERAATRWFATLADGLGTLSVSYVSTLQQPVEWWSEMHALEDRTAASQRAATVLEAHLKRNLHVDVARGSTTIGPHRDDIAIAIESRPVERFGSRGQQRIAVVALKLAEVEVVAMELDMQPILLLDDVLSELDDQHQQQLMRAASDANGQLLITSADSTALDRTELGALPLVKLVSPGVLAT
jgi:DNA replication and repair protein RecF